MEAVQALGTMSGLALLAMMWSRRHGEASLSKLPQLELLWFHASVTYPVLAKGPLGDLIVGASEDRGTAYVARVFGPALLVSLVVVVRRLFDAQPRPFVPGLFFVGAAVIGVPFVISGEAGPLTVLSIVLALAVLFMGNRAIDIEAWGKHARVAVVVITSTFLVTALVSPDDVIGKCWGDKCVVFGQLLTSSVTQNANFSGLAIALLMPWALWRLRTGPMLIFGLSCLGVITLSGSRSSTVTAAFVLLFMLLASRPKTDVRRIAGAAAAVGLAASLVTAIGHFSYETATYRGALWMRARELFEAAPFVGWGPNYWENQTMLGGFGPNYAAHNLWLELAEAGGLAMVALIALSGVTLLVSTPHSLRPAMLFGLASVLALGMLEAPLQPAEIGIVPFAGLLPLMIASTAKPRSGEDRAVSVRRRRAVLVP